MQRFSPIQRKVSLGCFVIYSGAYIARLNLAAALPALMTAMALTETQVGLIQTVFALIYAVGQLVNGAIVDRVSARRYIVAGLVLSALCNILFGFSRAYWQLLVFWALNGAAQSMLWTPIVKLIAGWFEREQRRRVSMWMSYSMIGGHLIAWALSGIVAQHVSWRMSFVLPALTQLLFACLALVLLHDPPQDRHATVIGENRPAPVMPLGEMFFGTGLLLVLICAVASGFVRDGVMAWGPTLLASLDMGYGLSPAVVSLIIPPINLAGVILGQYFLKRSAGKTRRIIGLLMAAGCAVSLLLAMLSGVHPLLYAALLGVCCALMNGVNPLMTVMLPMDYARVGRVGLAAGIIDGAVYLGSALVSVTMGYTKSIGGMTAVFICWAGVAAIGCMAVFLSQRGTRRFAKYEY